jgi:hypothetical protein
MLRLRMILMIMIAGWTLTSCGYFKDNREPMDPVRPAYERINFAEPRATSDERTKCVAVGGVVQMGGLLGHEICVQSLPDAGKVCKGYGDCLGACLSDGNFKPGASPQDEVTGKCAPTDNRFGCYGTVHDGRFQGVLCVD